MVLEEARDTGPWFDENGWLARRITVETANWVYHTGQCDRDAEYVCREIGFHVDRKDGENYLASWGFDRKEVEKKTDKELDEAVLWMICGTIHERAFEMEHWGEGRDRDSQVDSEDYIPPDDVWKEINIKEI